MLHLRHSANELRWKKQGRRVQNETNGTSSAALHILLIIVTSNLLQSNETRCSMKLGAEYKLDNTGPMSISLRIEDQPEDVTGETFTRFSFFAVNRAEFGTDKIVMSERVFAQTYNARSDPQWPLDNVDSMHEAAI